MIDHPKPQIKDQQTQPARYLREDGKVIIEVAVKNSRQLFNERDPAPFRARDLDENFVNYVLSSVQEFPLKTEMKMRIEVRDESELQIKKGDLAEAIKSHFAYESQMTKAKTRKLLKTGRYFLFIGILVLFSCLAFGQLIAARSSSKVGAIISEGFVIIGWVAMWRPIEVFLYDWWPLREQKLYLIKIAEMPVEVVCSGNANPKF